MWILLHRVPTADGLVDVYQNAAFVRQWYVCKANRPNFMPKSSSDEQRVETLVMIYEDAPGVVTQMTHPMAYVSFVHDDDLVDEQEDSSEESDDEPSQTNTRHGHA